MIHGMASATVRDLRTRFPRVRALVAREGEVIVTLRGSPAYVLRPYTQPPPAKAEKVNYFRRLKSRQPRPLTANAACALDKADRGER